MNDVLNEIENEAVAASTNDTEEVGLITSLPNFAQFEAYCDLMGDKDLACWRALRSYRGTREESKDILKTYLYRSTPFHSPFLVSPYLTCSYSFDFCQGQSNGDRYRAQTY